MKFIDLAILIDTTLIVCDVHIGIEDAMSKQGILIPRFHFRDVLERMGSIIRQSGISRFDRIIINGDIKHEFGKISDEEWRNTLKFITYLSGYTDEIILIRGNHDTILGPIAEKRKVMLVDNYKIKDILITHGDKIPDNEDLKGIRTIIIGHEHPAITIREGQKRETFKCFLVGRYKTRKLIVQPSLNLLAEGTDINEDDLLSPFLHHELGDFEVFIVGDKIYDFSMLNNINKASQ